MFSYSRAVCVLVVSVFFILNALNAQQANDDFTEITQLGKALKNIEAGKDQWKYFKINVQQTLAQMTDTDTLSVMITPYSGDIDLFIDNSVFPTSKDCTTCWKSTSPNGDIISIAKTDDKWPRGTPSALYIGVLARSVATFSINTWLTGTHIQLENGLPQSAKTLRKQYTYFDFTLDDASNFTISVTPISGDPDIYASVDVFEPNATSYTWYSRDWGYDVVSINSADSRYRSGVTYHIGILAFTEVFFTIAITKDQDYTLLVEGVPLSNSVEKKDFKFFKFYLSTQKNLIVNLNPLTSGGDPDIFVNYNTPDPKPNRDNAQWKATASGSDTLTILNAQSGWYFISVYGYTKTNFQLLASVETKNVMLYDGIKQHFGVEPGTWQYFKYYHADREAGMSLTVVPTGASELQVYVSRTTSTPGPDPGKHDYVAFKVGQQHIVSLEAPVEPGNFYIGVYGSTQANFSIIAATNHSHTVLLDGEISFWNSVPRGSYRYFLFDIAHPDQDTTITVNPWRGEVDLYVDPFVPFPKEGNATYVSRMWRQDTVVIPAGDPKLGGSSRIYIAVQGNSDAYFSITVYHSNTTIEVKDGISASGAVLADRYNFYRFYMPNAGSVSINLEVVDSTYTEADLYASTRTEKPSPFDKQWHSSNFGNDVIQIDYLSSGWLYIAVHGIYGERITYILTVRVNHQILSVNRVSMLSYTPFNVTSNYQAYVWQECDYLLAAVSLVSGKTVLYASSNGTAGPSNYAWKSESWPGNAILIPKTDPSFKQGYWNFAVQALANSDYFISLVCTANRGGFTYGAMLGEGVPRLGIAPASGFILYMFRANYDWTTQQVLDDYSIYIRAIQGRVNVYVHQDYRIVPNPSNFTFSSVGGSDRIMFLPRDKLKWGYVYIGVYGSGGNQNPTFEITVSKAKSPKFLMQDQPQAVSIAPQTSSYFRVLNARDAKELFAYSESCDNNPAPPLYADLNNPYPGAGNSSFKSESVSVYQQRLYVKLPKQDDPNLRVAYVGVSNLSPFPSRFAVFASNDKEDSRPIVPPLLMFGGHYQAAQIKIRFPKAFNPGRFSGRTLTYKVFKAEIVLDKNDRPNDINMDTACGAQQNGRFDGIATDVNPLDNFFDYIMNIEPPKIYKVNVVVTDDLGLSAAYKPVWVVNGQVYNSWPGIFLFQVSIGFILILIAFFIFTAYFVFGSIINVIRGKRGLQVVPNVEFWKDLPFLVLDGIKLIVTCGRRTDSYSQFSDETSVNTSGFDQPPTTAPTTKEVEKEEPAPKPTQSTGGYGTI